MTNVPVVGILRYNGILFNSTTTTDEFRVTPVWDAAGRTVTHSRFFLTASMVIQTAQNDRVPREAVARLTQPACELVYNGRGYGNFVINLPGGAKDCMWGPKPVSCTLKPYGAGKACKLTWSVEFAIPTCFDGRYDGPMEFAYKTVVNIDKSGYSSRVYSGFLRIAQTRAVATDRTIRLSADEWRERINPPLLTDFRRIPGTFELSEDKCRLDFSIRDEQLGPNVPPNGVIEAEADHTFASTPGNPLSWTGTLTATYEVALDVSVANAVQAFGAMAQDRLKALKEVAAAQPPFGRAELMPIPVSFTVADQKIYERTTVHMAMQYRVAGAKLDSILALGGLWNVMPGSNSKDAWGEWVASIKDALSPRGYALLRFTPGETGDSIVDLCGPVPALPATWKKNKGPQDTDLIRRNTGGGGKGKPGGKGMPKETELRGGKFVPPKGTDPASGKTSLMPPAPPSASGSTGGFLASAFPVPTPARSWIDYVVGASFEVDQGVAVGRTLPTIPQSPSVETRLGGAFTGTPFASTAGAVVTHQRTVPLRYVVLTGYATRAGYPVPMPCLTSWNGAPVVACNRADSEFFEQTIVGNAFYPVYGARWRLRYVCPNPPTGALPVVPNPFLT